VSGTIPTQLSAASTIRTLGLGRNALSGTIPPGVGKLRALESLILETNRLSGSMPEAICELPTGPNGSFYTCDLAHNRFHCPLPRCGRGQCGASCHWWPPWRGAVEGPEVS
jgi:hypothetical protein